MQLENALLLRFASIMEFWEDDLPDNVAQNELHVVLDTIRNFEDHLESMLAVYLDRDVFYVCLAVRGVGYVPSFFADLNESLIRAVAPILPAETLSQLETELEEYLYIGDIVAELYGVRARQLE